MDPVDYITQRMGALTEDADVIHDQADETNDFDSWSALKLILHSAVVNMYTTVMSNRDYFEDIYYIDALAGTGISTYHEDHCFVGSPIIAARSARMPFTKMYFIEENEDYCEALRTRLDFVFESQEIDIVKPDDWEVIPGNTNDKIPEVISEINGEDHARGYNYYCFIDNQALDVKWSSIKSLTPKPWGDLLVNLPTAQAIGRTAGLPKSRKLNEFYGLDLATIDIPDNNIRNFMKNLYIDRLCDRGRSITRSTHVDANVGSFGYDLVYATRPIEDGNDYVEVVDYVKEMVENVHAGDVDNILDVLYGDQSTIKRFLPETEDIESNLPEETDDQSDLNDWFE